MTITTEKRDEGFVLVQSMVGDTIALDSNTKERRIVIKEIIFSNEEILKSFIENLVSTKQEVVDDMQKTSYELISELRELKKLI